MFMTVFFMFIFYSMPAGLTLYWTVNQLLTMVQHLMLRRADNSESTAGAAA
jgi:membrane protein insertase Oxa1/YidC/SpoIIIJ